jgi:hypothetical protein
VRLDDRADAGDHGRVELSEVATEDGSNVWLALSIVPKRQAC